MDLLLEQDAQRGDDQRRAQPGQSLAPFSCGTGGYLMYWDDHQPEGKRWAYHFADNDKVAAGKVAAKMKSKGSRLGRRTHHERRHVTD